jgi:hypothetical protein
MRDHLLSTDQTSEAELARLVRTKGKQIDGFERDLQASCAEIFNA